MESLNTSLRSLVGSGQRAFSEREIADFAKQAANAFRTNQTPLLESVVKIARDQGFNRDQTTRLAEAANVQTFLALRMPDATGNVSFPVVNPKVAVASVTEKLKAVPVAAPKTPSPAAIKTAAARLEKSAAVNSVRAWLSDDAVEKTASAEPLTDYERSALFEKISHGVSEARVLRAQYTSDFNRKFGMLKHAAQQLHEDQGLPPESVGDLVLAGNPSHGLRALIDSRLSGVCKLARRGSRSNDTMAQAGVDPSEMFSESPPRAPNVVVGPGMTSTPNVGQGMPGAMAPPPPQAGMPPPGMDPNMAPPGMDPNMAPPGMDPNMAPPGMAPPGMAPGMGMPVPGLVQDLNGIVGRLTEVQMLINQAVGTNSNLLGYLTGSDEQLTGAAGLFSAPPPGLDMPTALPPGMVPPGMPPQGMGPPPGMAPPGMAPQGAPQGPAASNGAGLGQQPTADNAVPANPQQTAQ